MVASELGASSVSLLESLMCVCYTLGGRTGMVTFAFPTVCLQ